MKAGRWNPARPEVKSAHTLILFWVGPYRIGIPAAALKEIRNDSGLSTRGHDERPQRPSGVGATVSARELFGLPAAGGGCSLILRARNVAVQVDRVERMVETSVLRPLPRAFQGDERRWFSGFTLLGEWVVPVLNSDAVVIGTNALRDEPPAAGAASDRKGTPITAEGAGA